jgi:hypothetical protein
MYCDKETIEHCIGDETWRKVKAAMSIKKKKARVDSPPSAAEQASTGDASGKGTTGGLWSDPGDGTIGHAGDEIRERVEEIDDQLEAAERGHSSPTPDRASSETSSSGN